MRARSWTRSKVARTMSSCFSLAQTHSISMISLEKKRSSMASSFMISLDLLISSTWGFSMKMYSMIFSSMIHRAYFSWLSHFVYAYPSTLLLFSEAFWTLKYISLSSLMPRTRFSKNGHLRYLYAIWSSLSSAALSASAGYIKVM